MTPFSVYSQLSKPEFIRLFIRRAYRNPIISLVTVVGALILMLALLEVFGLIPPVGSPFSTVILGLYFVASSPIRAALSANRVYNTSPFLEHAVSYSFDDNGVQLSGNKDLEMKLGWSQFTRKQSVGSYILLYTSLTNAYIIPRDQFADDELTFIAAKIPKGKF